MSEDHGRDSRFWFGFFLGGLLGALIIFFLGTKEGKKVKRELEEKGKDLLDELEEKVDDLKDQGREFMKKGEELKEQVVESLGEKKEELVGEAVARLDTALENLEELQKKSAAATADLRKRFFRNLPKKS